MQKSTTCIYYMQGICKYGQKCYFSHSGLHQALVVRHTESQFNKFVNAEQIAEQQKIKMQLSPHYIDCPLTEQGYAHACNIEVPSQYLSQKRELDIVFVSPLNRTLQTAELIIRSQQLKAKRIIVIPELTEVLSKICDFSSNMTDKMAMYKNFDFRQMERYLKETQYLTSVQHWQDDLLDPQYHQDIQPKQSFGFRYLKILQKVFPTPLQNGNRCFKRSQRALEVMKQLIQKYKAQKIIIVSHNRVLRYIQGRFIKGRARSFQNGEVRKIIF